jgi:death on curing protein
VSEREPWIHLTTYDQILLLHEESIKRFGGNFSTPRDGCVEGSLGAAWSFELYMATPDARQGLSFSGALLFYLIKNHCFTDGNKRIAWLSAIEVLRMLGLTVSADADEAEQFCLDVISGTIKDTSGVVSWIARRLEEFSEGQSK